MQQAVVPLVRIRAWQPVMIVPTATDANTQQGIANLGNMSHEAVCPQRDG